MERKIQIGLLCEIYGSLLTKRQFNILNDYANSDLSLTEIAENNNITRQAVNDIVKKGELKLLSYEEKLGVMEKTLKQEKKVQEILTELSKLNKDVTDTKLNKKLETIKKQLKKLDA